MAELVLLTKLIIILGYLLLILLCVFLLAPLVGMVFDWFKDIWEDWRG